MTEAKTARLLIPKIILLPLAAGTHLKRSGFNPNRHVVGSHPHPSTTQQTQHPRHFFHSLINLALSLWTAFFCFLNLRVILIQSERAERNCQSPDDTSLHSALTAVVLQQPSSSLSPPAWGPQTVPFCPPSELTHGKQLSFLYWGSCIIAVREKLVSNASTAPRGLWRAVFFHFLVGVAVDNSDSTGANLPLRIFFLIHIPYAALFSCLDTDWESSPSGKWKWRSFCKISRHTNGDGYSEGWRVDFEEAWWKSIFSQARLPYKYVNELWLMYSA